MRIKLVVIAVILSLVTVVSGPAFVGAQNGDPFVLNITKVVEGPGFPGPYGVTVTCGGRLIGQFGAADGFTVSTDDPEFFFDPIFFNDECIVTEIDVADIGGRDAVTYACEATMDTTCVNDQTVAFDVSDAGGVGSITITNTFEREPPPVGGAAPTPPPRRALSPPSPPSPADQLAGPVVPVEDTRRGGASSRRG